MVSNTGFCNGIRTVYEDYPDDKRFKLVGMSRCDVLVRQDERKSCFLSLDKVNSTARCPYPIICDLDNPISKSDLHFCATASLYWPVMIRILIFLLLVSPLAALRAATVGEITQQVSDGHWQQARSEIAAELQQTNLNAQTRQDLLFQRDRMMRMRLDFGKTREQVFDQVRAVVPTVTEEQFSNWEKSGAIESMDIDGKRWYFNSAARNLFHIRPEAEALKEKFHPHDVEPSLYRLKDIQNVIADYDKTGERSIRRSAGASRMN